MSKPTLALRRCAIALSAATALAAAPAHAEDRAAAQGLFDEAMKLIASHAFDRACPKLEEVVRLQPGKVGAMVELARCYELAGKVASAWARYRAAADAAALHDARGKAARAKAEDLRPLVPKMTFAIAPETRGTPGLKITRDGVEVNAPEWDVAVPIDPGTHRVAAYAPGKTAWVANIDVSTRTTTRVDVPPLVDEPVAVVEPPPSPSPGPWIVGGVGVAGLLVGGITGAIVLKDKQELASQCNTAAQTCTSAGHSLATQGKALGPVSTVGLVLGVVGVGAGVTWLVVRSKKKTEPTVGLGPVVTAGGATWRVGGSFQ